MSPSVVVLLTKYNCPACVKFTTGSGGQASEWQQLHTDPQLRGYTFREFYLGTAPDGKVYTLPSQFSGISTVPTIVKVDGAVYSQYFDLQTGAVAKTSQMPYKAYDGNMAADDIKRWILK